MHLGGESVDRKPSLDAVHWKRVHNRTMLCWCVCSYLGTAPFFICRGQHNNNKCMCLLGWGERFWKAVQLCFCFRRVLIFIFNHFQTFLIFFRWGKQIKSADVRWVQRMRISAGVGWQPRREDLRLSCVHNYGMLHCWQRHT